MAPTATTKERVSKRKLTEAQAVEQWKKARRAIDRNKPLLEEAAEVLLARFDRTGTTEYKGVGLTITPARLILDQPKVRAFLGEKLRKFQKRTKPSKSLTLIEE